MNHHARSTCRASAGVQSSLVIPLIVIGIAAFFIRPAASQHPYAPLNTPPILYVPDRNWRIPETEQIGQIIARIRAEDAENDELVFGLEPHFHSNYANPNDNGVQGDSTLASDSLPFRIDSAGGVVYLNESLIGRAGENFFLYITVSDGQLTAKNEVFVNILGSNGNKFNSRKTPSITNVVHNISQFLPAFDQLPGVQSVRNQQLYNAPSKSVEPSFFSRHRPVYGTQAGGGDSNGYHVTNINPNQHFPVWPTNYSDGDDNNANDSEANVVEDSTERSSLETSSQVATTTRTKLTPVWIKSQTPNEDMDNALERKNSSAKPARVAGRPTGVDPQDIPSLHSTTAYSIKAATIPLIITVCGLFAAALAVFGYLFRKRLCAIGKTLKKKSKEEMAKKSNQSNTSSNLQDDSRNSMVMQHWNGPVAYGNRYVPWERDQQPLQEPAANSQISRGVVNGANYVSSAVALGGTSGSNVVGVGLGVNGGEGPSYNSSLQGKYDRWEFPRHRLKFFNILGEGAFGQVWRCEATDIDGFEGVTTVAVKTLKENATEVEKNDLVSELRVMKSLEPHVNVVRLLGCCTDKDPLFVVIEYVNRGKLQTYLRNSRAERHYGNTHGKSNILTSSDLTSFMYQVGKGMDYLTSRGIIHRDLAARNVLITDEHTCKVADFGFARDIVTSKIYERKSEGKLPIRWMAIESLYDNIFSVKSDIWSFGVLMWEIVTLGSTPYPGISAADVMHKVRDGHRLEKPEHCRRELYNIMYYCWSENANERPTFAEVVQMLDKLLHTEMDYIELERFPDHNYYNILNLSGEKL